MAFKLSEVDVGRNAPPIEYFHTSESDVALGMALTLASGELTKCTGAVRPDYISVGPQNADGVVPCIKVQAYQVFETTLQALGSSLNLGDKVTIHTDAEQVTAETSSGVAQIVRFFDKKAAGDRVLVRF